MFLSELNSQDKKELFLQLAIHAAYANDVLASEEEIMLKQYCDEMSIQEYSLEKNTELPELLDKAKSVYSKREQRIVMFELLAVINSDSESDDKEKEFVKELREAFDVSEDTVEKMSGLIAGLMKVYDSIAAILE
jgi:hypothetical protein